MKYDSRFEFSRNVENDDTVTLTYNPSNPNHSPQSVTGTVDDIHMSEWTKVVTDDTTYYVYGSGFTDVESGEVHRGKGNGSRKVGTFETYEVDE